MSLIGTPGKPGLDMGDDELSIIKAHAKELAAGLIRGTNRCGRTDNVWPGYFDALVFFCRRMYGFHP